MWPGLFILIFVHTIHGFDRFDFALIRQTISKKMFENVVFLTACTYPKSNGNEVNILCLTLLSFAASFSL